MSDDLVRIAARVRELQEQLGRVERDAFRIRLEMGLVLVRLRDGVVTPGSWVDWLNTNGISRRTASRSMKIARAARARFPDKSDDDLVTDFGRMFPSVRAFEAAVRRRGGEASIAFREEARAEAGRERELERLVTGGRSDGEDRREDPGALPAGEDQGPDRRSHRADAGGSDRSKLATVPGQSARRTRPSDDDGQLTFFQLWEEIESRATRSVREIRSLAELARRVDGSLAAKLSTLADGLVEILDQAEQGAQNGASMVGAQ